MTTDHVCGEPIEALLRAFARCDTSDEPDGMVHLNVELAPEEAAPLRRALMRIEADLLLEDADRVGELPFSEERTPGQRRADAIVELACRIGNALPS